jgi:hypothetical protein
MIAACIAGEMRRELYGAALFALSGIDYMLIPESVPEFLNDVFRIPEFFCFKIFYTHLSKPPVIITL